MSNSQKTPAPESLPPDGVTAEGEAYASQPRRLHYVDVKPPAPGTCVPVAPGVLWGRIPLPIDLDHINVWLLESDEGYVIVDTGMAVEMGKDAWMQIAADVFGRKPVRAVFITHIHPDHIGLAAWLQQQHGAAVWMSARTFQMAEELLGGRSLSNPEEAEAFFRAHGVQDTASLKPMFSPQRFARMASGMPTIERFVADAEVIDLSPQHWMAMETNGHAEGHLCLSNAQQRLLISGDQVLPTISSNISFTWRNVDANPLHSFLSSLQRLRALPADTLVLPSHGVAFRGLQHRIDDLTRHHEEQLEKLVAACGEPKAAVDILPLLFRRKLIGMHLFLGLAEALAHLEYLATAQRVHRQRGQDGTIRYCRA